MAGQTGFVPDIFTENYYFPKNHVGVTVLSNVDYNSGGFKEKLPVSYSNFKHCTEVSATKNKDYFISKAL